MALSVPQVSVMIVLMAEADEVTNPELKERYNIKLDGEERRQLNDLKLVESRKRGRAYAHVLTDDGWARLAEEISAGVKVTSGSNGAALRALLAGLVRFLSRTDQRFGDVFQPTRTEPDGGIAHDLDPADDRDSDARPDAARPDAARSVADGAVADRVVERQEVEARVRAAYTELAREPGDWVSLADVRVRLADVPRDVMDEALRHLNRQPDVVMVPENNQKALRPEDRTAALAVGDQDKHYLSIGAR
ncbi:hypothetical protein ACFXJ8_20700 [Nonomuraea sp. NPDC059194]|uniref:hypothetical protein n=1 Tax=Nonomuraea sp. NPDC059194 TaxID=3346764 RepID=UPI0036B83CDB